MKFRNPIVPLNTLPWTKIFDAALWLVFFALSWFLMQHTFQYRNDTFLIRDKLWSDFGAHIPLIRSFSLGDNYALEHPLFAGEPIRYHFLFYSWVGLLEKAGVNIAAALNWLSAAGLTFLLWLLYRLGSMMFARRSAGLIAVGLFLLNGSLSFLFFFQKHPLHWGSWKDIVTAQHFSSFGPWNGLVSIFWTLNIYTNQRHLALSYAFTLVCLWPLLKYVGEGRLLSRRYRIAIVLVAALSPLLHHVIVPIVLTYVIFWFIFSPALIRPLGLYYFLLFVCAVPALWSIHAGSPPEIVYCPGFVQQPKNFLEWGKYWFYNLGLYSVMIPAVFVWGKKPLKIWMGVALIFFAASNLWRFSPDMFNNHKLVNFFMISIQVAVAGFLASCLSGSRWAKAAALLLLFALTFSGIVDVFPILNDHQGELRDYRRSPTAVWLKDNTPADAVYLCTAGMYCPPSLLGRRIYIGYVYFPWSAGLPAYERLRTIEPVFLPTADTRSACRVLKQEKIDYIVVEPGRGAWPDTDIRESSVLKTWEPVFSHQEGYRVYSVGEECAGQAP
ncbi:MAG TPA: hypothetical protein PLT76_10680 [Candidatus Omnitrophota bacterium]|nr:hypothetical protein [Candidatus Omnitrophota bacterium]HPB67433.1 hypothetical protein [Candidatus Omnitrophota bacterium]HQO59164.1 hypothetical protein [Candidatus Omnitrophota bacterium]